MLFYLCLQHHEQHHFLYVYNIMNNIILFMFTTSWTTSFYLCWQHHEQHHFIYVYNIMNNIILFMFTTSWTTSCYLCLQHHEQHHFIYVYNIMNSLLLKCVLIIWWRTWNKTSTWWANFSEDKSLFGTWYGRLSVILHYVLILLGSPI